jgi:hypothetical protein
MIPATDLLPPDLQASDYERLCLQKLEAEEVAALGRFGRNRTFADGEHLFRTGDRDLSVFIVLRGEARVYFTRGGKEHELVVVGEGNFIGDVSMLTRMAAVASVRARGQLEVVEIPEKEFRRALSDYAAIAAKIIRAFVLRRQWLESMDDFSGVLLSGPCRARVGCRPGLIGMKKVLLKLVAWWRNHTGRYGSVSHS